MVGGVPQAGTCVSVNSGPTIYLNFGYAFTGNLVLGLLADITSMHDVNATGQLLSSQDQHRMLDQKFLMVRPGILRI